MSEDGENYTTIPKNLILEGLYALLQQFGILLPRPDLNPLLAEAIEQATPALQNLVHQLGLWNSLCFRCLHKDFFIQKRSAAPDGQSCIPIKT